MSAEIFCNTIAPAKFVESHQKLDLVVGTIVSDALQRCINFDCSSVSIPEGDACAFIAEIKPDFLLIETTWQAVAKEWELSLLEPEKGELAEILSFCKLNSIPVILWHTAADCYTDIFLPLAQKADFLFCVSRTAVARYKGLGIKNIEYLPPAVQPRVHNPFQYGDLRGATQESTFLVDSWADLLEYPELSERKLSALVENGLTIVDPKWTFLENKRGDIPALADSIAGRVSYLQLVSAYKAHPVCIFPSPCLSSTQSRTRRALEALSCGAIVLYEGELDLPDSLSLPGLVKVQEAEELSAVAADALARLDEFSVDTHLSKRELWLSHTYRHRLRAMCQVLGIALNETELPLVSLVTPTKRPQFLKNCIDNFHRQTYPNKQLVVALNTSDEAAITEAKEIVAAEEGVELIVLHQEDNIAACLNIAIQKSSGDYWFKVDDDDFYGENYVLDFVLALNATGADAFGKPAAYMYLEEEDALYLKRNRVSKGMLLSNPERGLMHPCGATLGGTRAINQKLPFSLGRRANVDLDFVIRVTESDCSLFVGDIYNFSIFRAADKRFHTWREKDSILKWGASRVTSGRGDDVVSV
ncbi:glycosyltransferase [Microbulbifer agarilyticus]|uniref:glycosyltransferase n=1 Tax=Microbulbifer agarilyticus TaxID=260552 RepID=UPI001C946C4D|nr:glycosyltransferase [Microbulbifer agarilyticus]MBY6189174.1 glycosyltransferase [Microbulbifer agarilyticus]